MSLKEKIISSKPIVYAAMDESSETAPLTCDLTTDAGREKFVLTNAANSVFTATGLQVTTTSGANSTAHALFTLTGNFDIEIEFTLNTYPATNSWYFDFYGGMLTTGGANNVTTRIAYGASARHYRGFGYDNGTFYSSSNIGTSDTSGKLRIVRSGDQFSTYYDNAGWQLMSQRTYASSVDVVSFFLNMNADTGNPTAVATMTKLVVNSGTIIRHAKDYVRYNTYLTNYNATPAGQTGLLVNDSDTCFDFTAANSNELAMGVGTISALLNGASAATVELVAKADSYSGLRRPFTSFIGTTLSGLTFRHDGTNMEIGGRSQAADAYQVVEVAESDTTAPHHWVGILDFANDSGYLYRDGVLVASSTSLVFGASTYTDANTQTPYDSIGSSNGAEYWDGQIQHFAIYDKALTTQEIYDHYAEARQKYDLPDNSQAVYQRYPMLVKNSAPLAYWKLNVPDATAPYTQLLDSEDYFRPVITSNASILTNQGVSVTSSGGDYTVGLRMCAYGDFDVQVDFDITAGPATNFWHVKFGGSWPTTGGGSNFFTAIRQYSGGNNYISDLRYDGNTTNNTATGTDTTGKLRCTRSGTTVTTWKWNGSTWDQIHTRSYSGGATLPPEAFFYVGVNSGTGNPTVTTTFSNFTVNSGTIQFYSIDETESGVNAQPYGNISQAQQGLTVNDSDTCFQFDGVEDHMKLGIGTGAALMNGAAAVSLEAVFQADSSYGVTNYIYHQYIKAGTLGLCLRLTDGDLLFVARSVNTDSTGITLTITGNHVGYPMHVVGIADFTNDAMYVYINGELAGTGTPTFTNTTYTDANDQTLDDTIGSYGTPEQYFDGKIQHVALYKRALTEDEIINHYQTAMVRWDIPALPAKRSYSQLVMAGSPIAYYRLNETSGTTCNGLVGPTGTYNGGVTLNQTSLLANDDDPSITLNGTDDVITFPDTPALEFQNTDTLTVEAVIRDITTAGVILGNSDGNVSWKGWIFYAGTNFLTFELVSVAASNSLVVNASPGISFSGASHHVAVTYDGSQDEAGLKFYIDGTEWKQRTITYNNLSTSITYASWIPMIGARGQNSGSIVNAMAGKVDEVAAYDRVLNSDEIKAHAAEALRTNPDVGTYLYDQVIHRDKPVAWWRLGEAAGIVSRDDKGTYVGEHSGGVTLNSGTVLSVDNTANSSIAYDGTNGKTGFGDVLDFERTDSFSIECFFNTSAAATNYLLTKLEDSGNFRGIEVDMLSNGAIRVLINSVVSTNQINTDTDTTGFNDGADHHCVVTYDGSSDASGVKIYVDGVKEATTANTNNLSTTILNSEPWLIGARGAGYGDTLIDEAAIYDYVLTPEQVAEHYTAANYVTVTTNWTIAGTLTDETGAAVTSSTLRLFRTDTQALVDSQTTDGSGNYTFDNSSVALSNIEYLLVPEGQVGVKPVSNVIEGYVQFRYGQPQVGVNVWCIKKSDQTVIGVEATNEQGWFQFAGLTAATEYLIAVEYGNAVYPEQL